MNEVHSCVCSNPPVNAFVKTRPPCGFPRPVQAGISNRSTFQGIDTNSVAVRQYEFLQVITQPTSSSPPSSPAGMRSLVNCYQHRSHTFPHVTYISLTSDLNVCHFVVDNFDKMSSSNSALGDKSCTVTIFQTVAKISSLYIRYPPTGNLPDNNLLDVSNFARPVSLIASSFWRTPETKVVDTVYVGVLTLARLGRSRSTGISTVLTFFG
jgi:hypothetical protein